MPNKSLCAIRQALKDGLKSVMPSSCSPPALHTTCSLSFIESCNRKQQCTCLMALGNINHRNLLECFLTNELRSRCLTLPAVLKACLTYLNKCDAKCVMMESKRQSLGASKSTGEEPGSCTTMFCIKLREEWLFSQNRDERPGSKQTTLQMN